MQISLDSYQGKYYITAYGQDSVSINQQPIKHSLIVSSTQLIEPWRPTSITELNQDDLRAIFALTPEIVLLGTGCELQLPMLDINMLFYQQNIGIEIMNTGAACRTFDALMSEGRNVVAALII